MLCQIIDCKVNTISMKEDDAFSIFLFQPLSIQTIESIFWSYYLFCHRLNTHFYPLYQRYYPQLLPAIRIWIFTAFCEFPKNLLMCRGFYLRFLKKVSICHLERQEWMIVPAAWVKSLVRKFYRIAMRMHNGYTSKFFESIYPPSSYQWAPRLRQSKCFVRSYRASLAPWCFRKGDYLFPEPQKGTASAPKIWTYRVIIDSVGNL